MWYELMEDAAIRHDKLDTPRDIADRPLTEPQRWTGNAFSGMRR